ncbi:hypothetical protein ACWIGW_04380 [Nocardia brasiliensis]
MRIRIVVAAFGAALVLLVSAVGLYYYDGGSRDHTHLQVGDCWDYSARFDEAVHLKSCAEPHYGEVILRAGYGALARHPSGGLDAWGFCKQRLSEILAKNTHLDYWMVPNDGILCAVTAAGNSDTRIGGLTGRIDR